MKHDIIANQTWLLTMNVWKKYSSYSTDMKEYKSY